MLRKLVQRFTFCLFQPSVNKNSLKLAILTLQFDDVSVKTIYRLLRKAIVYHISLEKLALLPLVKEVTRFPDRKMIKLLTFDILFSPPRHSR